MGGFCYYVNNMTDKKYDAILVLGGSLTPDGHISDEDKTRLHKVIELYKSDAVGAIVVCGSHSYKYIDEVSITEAEAYANYINSFMVSSVPIYLENESKETLGNILFAKIGILEPNNFRKLLVLPTHKHSMERIEYLLKKVLGVDYNWDVLRVGQSEDTVNAEREALALKHSKDINDKFADGDTHAIYDGLMETHPAYGGTRWTLDELREEMK